MATAVSWTTEGIAVAAETAAAVALATGFTAWAAARLAFFLATASG